MLELMPFLGYYRAAKINSAYLNSGAPLHFALG